MKCKMLRLILLLSIHSCLINTILAQQPGEASQGFKLFFEKVYLHLDRSYYAPGDDIWFKAYLVNAQNNLPFNTSNNLYVELIDPAATIVSRKVVRLDSVGVGDFHLEDSVAGGTYRIRAYTNWMRNFGDHFLFEKEIYVAGIPGVSKTDVANKKPASSNKKMPAATFLTTQFFPEGGAMVQDVHTIVAFKAEDANGKGVAATGFIQSSKGDTVVQFKTVHLGIGSFAFTPRAGISYRAFVQYGDGKFIEAALPAILPTGFVMNIDNSGPDMILVRISSNAATSKLYLNGMVDIAARHAGKSYFKQQINLNEGKADVLIPKKDFPSGIAYITLYDQNVRPQCERLVYIDKDSALNVKISSDKTTYRSREKATINITVTDAQNKPVKTALSLAAIEEGTEGAAAGNILSYLMLESELSGKIENASAYFDKNNSARLPQLDLLLQTQGWRSFLWRQLTDTTIRISYLPEAGITVSGSVVKPLTNKPLGDMNITLFAPDAWGDKIYLTKTNQSGKYYLDGLPLYGMQNIRLNVGDGIGKKIGEIRMDTLFSNPLTVATQPVYSIDSSAFHSFEKLATMRWTKFKNSQWSRMLPNVTVTAKSGTTLLRDGSALVNFGYPEYDFTITKKDYEYKRLRDFIVQKVPGAMYDDELEGVYFLSNGKRVRPVLFVNKGQDVFGRLDYYSLSMQQIESVHVRHMVGSPTYGGINNNGNESSEVDPENINLPPGIRDYFLITLTVKPGNANQQLSKINAAVSGYYEARIFYTPNYGEENPSEQDERTTIYWAPLITTDENGKASVRFYNADPRARIKLNLQGLSSNGIPVAGSAVYEVK